MYQKTPQSLKLNKLFIFILTNSDNPIPIAQYQVVINYIQNMEAKNGLLTSEATEALRAAEIIVSFAEEGGQNTPQGSLVFEDALQQFYNSQWPPDKALIILCN